MKIKCGTILSLTLLASLAHADIFGTGANQFSIDFVNIANSGNAADASGYGAVGYNYRMGKYEITIDQFVKARAADSRISNGNENYWNRGTRTVGINAPVARASWLESARFANWLTTGDAYTGAYQFDGSGLFVDTDRAAAVAAYGTVYVLPSEDEWYKAAYYKPVNDGSYSLYASGLDSLPTHGTTEGWNYVNSLGEFANEAPNYAWEVGFGGQEQNGTYDMTGNVFEWNEDAKVPGNPEDFGLIFRGGGWNSSEITLDSTYRTEGAFEQERPDLGFRIAAIPEPSSVLLLTIGSGGLLFYRRAKRREQENRPPNRRDFR